MCGKLNRYTNKTSIYSPWKYWKSIWCGWCGCWTRFEAIEAILVVDKLQIKCPSERIILHFSGIRLFAHVIGVGRCTQRLYCLIATRRTFIERSLIVGFESIIFHRERQTMERIVLLKNRRVGKKWQKVGLLRTVVQCQIRCLYQWWTISSWSMKMKPAY